jgi:hypothetical protein
MRVHLLRLHSEREHALALVSLLSAGRLEIRAGHQASEMLEAYLKNTLAFLEKGFVYGHDQDDLYKAAYAADSRFNNEDYKMLISTLQGMFQLPLEQIVNSIGGRESAEVEPRQVIITDRYEDYRRYRMGDEFKIEKLGQAGIIGSHASAGDIILTQSQADDALADIDMATLATQLEKLLGHLRNDASAPEQYAALGEVSYAAQAAKERDKVGTLEHLKNLKTVREWARRIGIEFGVTVAVAAIKAATGFP